MRVLENTLYFPGWTVLIDGREENIEFQVNTTVMRDNVSQLEEILQLAEACGAKSFHTFFLVPVGRGSLLKERQLSAEEYEAALTWLFRKTVRGTISCRPTCAPHYFRIAHQENFNPLRRNPRALARGFTPLTLTSGFLEPQKASISTLKRGAFSFSR